MNVRLLLAPAAAGKTQYCIERIQQVQRHAPLARVWVVVPDAAEARAFRCRLARHGGAINVQVGTFYSLYAELLVLAGQSVARLEDPVLYRLLRGIVDELYERGELQYYGRLRDKPGFFRALRTMIQELKRARAESQDFLDAVQGRGARLEELAAIYLQYQSWLYQSPWADAEGQGWLAAIALEENPALCDDWRLLVVDGFDQFNPTQLAVLRRLAGQTRETLVTLTGSQTPRLAHRRFDRARAAVESALGVKAELLPKAHAQLAPPLAHLEAGLFEPTPPEPAPADDVLTLLEVPGRAEESRAALRWLKQRHVHDAIPLHQMAILTRDLEPYRPFLEEIADEFGLPLAVAQGAWLDENPVIAALLDLLALPIRNWPRRLVVEAWRSPYFEWSSLGIELQDADRLEVAARQGQVIAGLDQWQDTLDRLAQVNPAAEERDAATGEDSDEMAAILEVPQGAAAAELRNKLDAFVERLTPPPHATLRDYTAWLEALIGDDPDLVPEEQSWSLAGSLGIVARARYGRGFRSPALSGRTAPREGVPLPTADRDTAALHRLKDVLRGLVFAESVLTPAESEPVSYERFYQELQGAVEATSYRVPAPEGQSAILAASVLSARGLTFRAVALVGLCEGDFPRAPQQDPLLRESDRVLLQEAGIDLEPRLLGDEVTLLYEAVTRATDYLLVTRPYLTDDGQPWEASPYWEQLSQRVEVLVRRARPEDPLPPTDAASPTELLASVAHGLSRGTDMPWAARYAHRLSTDPALQAAWQSVQAGAQVLNARTRPAARGPYEGDVSALRSRLSRTYGPDRPWSASRLETYAVCAHAFFAAYVLGFEPRQPVEAGYDVRQLGSMYHAVLEEVFRQAVATGNAPLDILPDVAREIFETAPETYGFRPTPLWDRQREEHERILAATVEALVEASEEWEPAYFEPPFGLHGVPPLELHGADGETLQLRGYIDRVDVNSEGQLRIIDYKSGSTLISARDLQNGKRVQLALYALAARDVLALGQPAAGMYWHIGSAKPSSLKLEAYEGGIEAALDTAVHHALAYAAGARRGDFLPRPPDSGCPPWCPAADYCWRYEPRGW